MVSELSEIFWLVCLTALLLALTGAYCIAVSRNLLRMLIGVELLLKAAQLLLIAAGFVTGRTGLTQSLVVTSAVIEIVFVSVAAGIAVAAQSRTGSLDVRKLRDM